MTNKTFFNKTENANDKQIGGNHYKLKIQPFDFIMENNLNFFQGNVIKYVVRYLKKNQIEDLNKIKNTNFKIKLDSSLISTPKSSMLSLPNCKDSLLEIQTALKSKISLLNLELKYYQSLQSKFKDFLNSDFSKSWAVYENELNLSNQNKIKSFKL